MTDPVVVELRGDELLDLLHALRFRYELDASGRLGTGVAGFTESSRGRGVALIERLAGLSRERFGAAFGRVDERWSDEEVEEFGRALSALVLSGKSWGGRPCCGRVFGCTCRGDR